ncbi:hypothetical protein J3Q64DRAFT_1357790 [Phycomyces blakesleeanus]|uniref:Exosome complex protein n=1 Tax=Phycomyces blakesleeanus TaxID=4837 RepID=A0ABR3AJL3_PHYBL
MDPAQKEIAKKALKALNSRTELVARHLEPLLSHSMSEVYTKLPVNERAQFQVLISYAINSLFYTYLRTQGHNPQEHQVMKEIVRIENLLETKIGIH